ncbi:ACT domain-containing protein ACR1 [Daucus carota subsp. sativus]|nr:PREDICTED: ACT domain-containing protein ACR1-like [Daucus carota subsp. sativus]
MVQVLTDLDLVILKGYISSDGGWFMDVFHVTDQLGNKITDEGLIAYIQKAMCARREEIEVQTTIGRDVRPWHVISTDQTAIEITAMDRPGLMSEIAAALVDMECNMSAAVAWTHNSRVACILYVEDGPTCMPIVDFSRMVFIRSHLECVVRAHHCEGERQSVILAFHKPGLTHTERRLHQLMAADIDYYMLFPYSNGTKNGSGSNRDNQGGTQVTICNEKDYSTVTVSSRDRPKLLFDTVCALTDMHCVVFHAAISSHGSTAIQEYYIRHKDGSPLNLDAERNVVTKHLIAAVERRASHGLRLEITARNRVGLLSEVTRVFRENALSLLRAEIGTQGRRAAGTFYVADTSGDDVESDRVEAIRNEIGTDVIKVVTDSFASAPRTSASTSSRTSSSGSSAADEEGSRFSLLHLLQSQFERFSSNLRAIMS